MPFLKSHALGTLIELHVQPQAPRSEIIGLHGDRLKVKIKAPPVDGAANDEIVRFFAGLLRRKQREVQILKGNSSKQKTILIEGLTIEEVRNQLSI